MAFFNLLFASMIIETLRRIVRAEEDARALRERLDNAYWRGWDAHARLTTSFCFQTKSAEIRDA